MLLVWFISCQILSWIWKRLKASVLPTPLTRNEQKHLPKAAQQRDSAPITNTGYLKLQRAISSTLSLLLMAFPPTTTTPNTWGNTTFFNHTLSCFHYRQCSPEHWLSPLFIHIPLAFPLTVTTDLRWILWIAQKWLDIVKPICQSTLSTPRHKISAYV